MFFGFQLTLGLMMVFYGYSVMKKSPVSGGDQGRRAVKAERTLRNTAARTACSF